MLSPSHIKLVFKDSTSTFMWKLTSASLCVRKILQSVGAQISQSVPPTRFTPTHQLSRPLGWLCVDLGNPKAEDPADWGSCAFIKNGRSSRKSTFTLHCELSIYTKQYHTSAAETPRKGTRPYRLRNLHASYHNNLLLISTYEACIMCEESVRKDVR